VLYLGIAHAWFDCQWRFNICCADVDEECPTVNSLVHPTIYFVCLLLTLFRIMYHIAVSLFS
jgi:hypothetical protein